MKIHSRFTSFILFSSVFIFLFSGTSQAARSNYDFERMQTIDRALNFISSYQDNETYNTDQSAHAKAAPEFSKNNKDVPDEYQITKMAYMTDHEQSQAQIAVSSSQIELPKEHIWDQLYSRHNLEVGTEISFYKYKEPGIMQLKGEQRGFNAEYTFAPEEGEFMNFGWMDTYRVEMIYSFDDDTKYEAEVPGIVSETETNDKIFDGRILLGKRVYNEMLFEKPFDFFGYFGFGLRHVKELPKEDRTLGSSSGTPGYFVNYQRNANYWYIPIGAEIYTHPTKDWFISYNYEFDWFLTGRQYSHFDDFQKYGYPNNDILIGDQDNGGYGARASVKFIRKGERMNLVLEPFFRYWHIDESNSQNAHSLGSYGSYIEPENKTWQYGVNLAAQF